MARSPGKAADFAERHRVPKWYDNVHALLSDPDIDAIYIATPPDSHLTLALEVAGAGKICSLEKPMAINATECATISQAFSAAQIPLFVAYYRRCLPAFRQLRDILASGALGEVLHVDWQYYRPPSTVDLSEHYNWRTDRTIAPGGYFDDIACHGLDILIYLIGDIKYATGTVTNRMGLYDAADSLSAIWQFQQGTTGTGSWQFCAAEKKDIVTITGSEGSLTFSVFSERPARVVTKHGTESIPMPKPDPIQKDYVEAMADALLRGSSHPSTGETATHTSWVMDQILGFSSP